MLIFSIKTSKKQLLSLLITVAALVLTVMLFLCVPQQGDVITAKPKGDTAEARVTFLGSLGYEVSEESEQSETVMLPSEFDEVLTRYNTLQQVAGMDLRPFAGQVLWRYTYAVSNYADEPLAEAHLYIFDGRIIGGDIASAEQNGFMHGLLPHDG